MALNPSGPISLGGSTTGQSVNLEIGQSATASVSLNSSAVRTLTGTLTNTTVSLPTNFYGQTYFAPSATFSYTTTYDGPGNPYPRFYTSGVVTDSSGNTYSAGTYYPPVSPYSFMGISKTNKFGVVQWQKYLTGLAFGVYGYSQGTGVGIVQVGLDSSNNIYIGFYSDFVAPGTDRGPGVVKLDSNGTVLWCSQINPIKTTIPYDYGFTCGALVGPSGTVFTGGIGQVYGSSTSQVTWIATLNSSGTYLSKKYIDGFNIVSFTIDENENIYVHGYSIQSLYGGSYGTATVIKLNSSLVIQWQRYYTVTTATGYPNQNCQMPYAQALTVAASGDLYVGGAVNYYRGGTGPFYYYGYVGALRLNASTGSVINATDQRVSSNYSGCTVLRVGTDSSNNLYLITSSNNIDHSSNSNVVSVLFKYPPALGSVTYQYRFETLGYNSTHNQYMGSIPSYFTINGTSITLLAGGTTDTPPGTPAFGSVIYRFPNNGSYFGSSRYFYPPATTTGYLSPDNPGFPTDSTFAASANTSAASVGSLPWVALSRTLSSTDMSLLTLTTTY